MYFLGSSLKKIKNIFFVCLPRVVACVADALNIRGQTATQASLIGTINMLSSSKNGCHITPLPPPPSRLPLHNGHLLRSPRQSQPVNRLSVWGKGKNSEEREGKGESLQTHIRGRYSAFLSCNCLSSVNKIVISRLDTLLECNQFRV